MSIITYCSIVVAALYINVSFIIQIALFENIQNSWIDFVGLDNFDSNNPNFAENIAGYAVTVCVYIVCLIYLKAVSRFRIKMKYLEQRHPERFLKQITSGLRARKFKKKKNLSIWETFLRQILTIVKNPYLHLLIFRFCLFGWIFLYFAFQSLIPLFLLCHSVVYHNRERFMSVLKYFYLPLMWLIFFFNYVINIKGLFNVSIYTADNWR